MAAQKKATAAKAPVSARAKTAGSPGLTTEQRKRAPESAFAFPKQRKEPLNDAKHVRNAVARFDQVEGVTDAERTEAWERIVKAAKRFDVELSEGSWHELMDNGSPKRSSSK